MIEVSKEHTGGEVTMAMPIEQLQSYKSCAQRPELKLAHTLTKGFKQYITDDYFALMEEIMNVRKFKKGSFLFWEGEPADMLYYVRSGHVKLMKSTEEGKNLIISVQQPGDLIAEMHGAFGTYHSYSAEAVTDLEIGVINRKDLDGLLRVHGDFSLQFMYWLGMTHQVFQSKLRDLLLYGKTGALASTLIRLSNTYGTKKADGSIHIQFKLTNSELGDMIGATRESVNRMLSEWKDAGTLDVVGGKIVIYKLEDLRGISHCPKSPACPIEICRL
jgi:CRP-like cAMP-binding protein